MFADFLPVFDTQQLILTDSSNTGFGHFPTRIVLQEFVDIDWDARGWYAIGHHQPKLFIAAVAKYELTHKLRESHVEQSWARIEGQQVEWFDEPIEGTQPVTFMLLFDPS